MLILSSDEGRIFGRVVQDTQSLTARVSNLTLRNEFVLASLSMVQALK